MNDTARQLPPQSDTPPDIGRRIPIKEVLPIFREAGLPRDIRSLQRYCESGLLDGLKELTATGETWFIAESSIAPAITQLIQMHSAKGTRQSRTSPDMSNLVVGEPPNEYGRGRDGPSTTASDSDGTDSSDVAQRPSQANDDRQPDMSALVEQYEKRLVDRGSEIDFYREELQERRSQIRDMKSIIDGQNELLGAINQSSEKIFTAIAETSHKRTENATDGEQDDRPHTVHVIETPPHEPSQNHSDVPEGADTESHLQP